MYRDIEQWDTKVLIKNILHQTAHSALYPLASKENLNASLLELSRRLDFDPPLQM